MDTIFWSRGVRVSEEAVWCEIVLCEPEEKLQVVFLDERSIRRYIFCTWHQTQRFTAAKNTTPKNYTIKTQTQINFKKYFLLVGKHRKFKQLGRTILYQWEYTGIMMKKKWKKPMGVQRKDVKNQNLNFREKNSMKDSFYIKLCWRSYQWMCTGTLSKKGNLNLKHILLWKTVLT